jgi:hypothetical protein
MKVKFLHKSHRPKFSSHRGRTWDLIMVKVNGHEYKGHFDTTWGFNAYVEIEGQWYAVSLDYANANCTMIDLDNPKKNNQ